MTGLVLSGSWFLSVVTCQIYLERASRKQVFHKLLHRKKLHTCTQTGPKYVLHSTKRAGIPVRPLSVSIGSEALNFVLILEVCLRLPNLENNEALRFS